MTASAWGVSPQNYQARPSPPTHQLMAGPYYECDSINRKVSLQSCHRSYLLELLVGQFLRGEESENASDDRECSHYEIAEDYCDQLTAGTMMNGETRRGCRGQLHPGNCGER